MAREYDYIAYIDESGDTGLKFVKPIDDKGSEWFVLAAVVVRAEHEANVPEWHAELMTKLRSPQMKHLHFRKLTDLRKTIVCQHLADLPIRCFVMASNKRNMRRYKNPFAEKKGVELVGAMPTYNWFYYWSSRILLEKVSDFVWRDAMARHEEPRKLRLEFSQNKSLRYDEIEQYLNLLRMHNVMSTQFVSHDDLRWDVMDSKQVHAFDHTQRAGLQFADAVAGAFFKACDVHDTGGYDPSYAQLLKPRMGRLPDRVDGKIAHYGVKLMPATLRKAKLHDFQEEIFRFYGYRR